MTYRIKTYNQIAQNGLAMLSEEQFSIDSSYDDPHGIVLRSTDLHGEDIPSSLMVVARAGAGTNNIPHDIYAKQAIPVMNTPGANANAVKELVIAGILVATRNLTAAWEATTQLTGDAEELSKSVEAAKKEFAGHELPGRKLGIIGLGHIGVLVANAATQLGMQVMGYDPAISITNAWQLDARVAQASSIQELVSSCDYLTVHVPLLDSTRGLINAELLSLLPAHAVLLNFARSAVVDVCAVANALKSDKMRYYVTDFPHPELQSIPQAICFPHLGATTLEATENCAVMACQQLRDYCLYGHLKHCVNLPNVELRSSGVARLCVFNENIPNMVAQITQQLSDAGINITDMINSSRNEVAYNLIDLDQPCPDAVVSAVAQIAGIIRLRQIIDS